MYKGINPPVLGMTTTCSRRVSLVIRHWSVSVCVLGFPLWLQLLHLLYRLMLLYVSYYLNVPLSVGAKLHETPYNTLWWLFSLLDHFLRVNPTDSLSILLLLTALSFRSVRWWSRVGKAHLSNLWNIHFSNVTLKSVYKSKYPSGAGPTFPLYHFN